MPGCIPPPTLRARTAAAAAPFSSRPAAGARRVEAGRGRRVTDRLCAQAPGRGRAGAGRRLFPLLRVVGLLGLGPNPSRRGDVASRASAARCPRRRRVWGREGKLRSGQSPACARACAASDLEGRPSRGRAREPRREPAAGCRSADRDRRCGGKTRRGGCLGSQPLVLLRLGWALQPRKSSACNLASQCLPSTRRPP